MAATFPSDRRPVLRPIEDAGGGRIRDAHTKDLVSTREIVAEYNAMLGIVQRAALMVRGDIDVIEDAQRFLKEGHL